jgi:hypothetical protein
LKIRSPCLLRESVLEADGFEYARALKTLPLPRL